jgi:WD40 repeat protein
MRIILLILVTMFVVSLAIPISLAASTAAQTEEAPYLYYYSDFLKAFVIERADGTDSRTLAANVMPAEHNTISGPHWSPSGRWFAWASREATGPGVTPFTAWIISTDGSRRVALLDEVQSAEDMVWSPTDDLLFVTYHTYAPPKDSFFYYLIDPDTEKIITTFEIPVVANTRVGRAAWTPDGNYVMFYYVKEDSAGSHYTVLRIVSRTGEIQDRAVGQYRVFWDFHWRGPQISSSGWLLNYTLDESILIAENFLTQERIEFSPAPFITDVYWSTDGENGLLWDGDPRDGTKKLWLLSISRGDITPLVAEAPLCDAVHACIYDEFEEPVWSPDGTSAALITTNGTLYVFDVSQRQMQPITAIHGRVILVRWTPDSRALLATVRDEDIDNMVILYDISDVQLTTLNLDAWGAVSSLDKRYMGITGSQIPTVVDLDSNQTRIWMPLSGAPVSYVYGYNWHASNQWLIFTEDMTFAGGGAPGGHSVARVDGTFRRELNYTEPANWLSDRVIPFLGPGNPESVIQQPVTTLEHDREAWGVAWSPDGTRIASYIHGLTSTTNSEIAIWEMSGSFAYPENRFSGTDCGRFAPSCKLSWSPDNRLLGADRPSGAEIWNPYTGAMVAQLQEATVRWKADGYEGISSSSAYSPDGSMIAQHSDENDVIEINEVASGKLILSAPAKDIRQLQWSPTGQHLAWIDDSPPDLILWDIHSGEQIVLAREESFYSMTWGFTFSPDGRLLARASY